MIGNPPYKGHSMNPSRIKGNLTFAGEIIQRFFQVRGEPLGEKNPKWLNNDYVKFIAFAMKQIEDAGAGVLGYITSNSWLESPTFRGVRTELVDSFPIVRIVDLHGNIKKGERAPDGSKDEGVFDIEEGTNIVVAAKLPDQFTILSYDLLGSLGDGTNDLGKLAWLENASLSALEVVIEPFAPFFVFKPSLGTDPETYFSWPSIKEIAPTHSLGCLTKRDGLTVDFTVEELEAKLSDFADPELTDEAAAERFGVRLADNDGWSVRSARDWLESNSQQIRNSIAIETFRPFDARAKIVETTMIARPNHRVLQHVGERSPALLLVRQLASLPFEHAFVTERRADQHVISVRTKEGGVVFPLFLRPQPGEQFIRPNLRNGFARMFVASTGAQYRDGIPRGEQQSMGADYRHQKAEQIGLLDQPWVGRGDLQNDFGPRDLFDWIYAILHAPSYRSRYAEFLKSDFPRIPIPKGCATFAALVPLGRRLVALHLLKPEEEPVLKSPDIRFAGTGEARVEKGYPKYRNGKVEISATRWFEDVPMETWDFHVGGYQVCDKWLKDRAGKGGQNPRPGRVLTDEDILHYRRVVTALTETRTIMAEIDAAIEKHGGWPGAFAIGTDAEEGE